MDAGYATSPLCPLCKVALDTEHHRWWHCPASKAARDSIADEDVQKRARAAGANSLLYCRGLVEHPDLHICPPADDLGEQLMVREAGGAWKEAPFDGCQELPHLLLEAPRQYMDGSCSTAPLAERRRAGWSLVWTDVEGVACGVLSGTVPRPFPQTPQAAEYIGGLISSQTAVQAQDVASDCLNVVRQFGQTQGAQLSYRKKFSGVVLQARGHRGWSAASGMRKVPAHVDIDAPFLTDAERSDARGNDAADEAAKAAAKRHPANAPSDEASWDRAWRDATTTAQLIAAVGPLWPAARPQGGLKPTAANAARKLQRAADRSAAAAARQQQQADHFATHDWILTRGAMRCGICHALASEWRRAASAPCRGHPQWLVAIARCNLREPGLGHYLSHATVCRPGECDAELLVCLRCAGYCEARASPTLQLLCKKSY